MNWISTGAIFSGLSVMLGAMGAHSLKNVLTEKNLELGTEIENWPPVDLMSE